MSPLVRLGEQHFHLALDFIIGPQPLILETMRALSSDDVCGGRNETVNRPTVVVDILAAGSRCRSGSRCSPQRPSTARAALARGARRPLALLCSRRAAL